MYSYGDGYHTVLILTTTLWLFSGLFVIYLLRNIWERTIPLVFFSISVWTSLKIQTVFFIKGCSRRAGIWSTHKGTLQTTCEKQFFGLDAYNSGKCWIPAVTRSKGTLALLELDSLGAESSQIGLVQLVCHKVFGCVALWYCQKDKRIALDLKKTQIIIVLVYVFFLFSCMLLSIFVHPLYNTCKLKAFYTLSGTYFVEDRWEARSKPIFPVANFLAMLF